MTQKKKDVSAKLAGYAEMLTKQKLERDAYLKEIADKHADQMKGFIGNYTEFYRERAGFNKPKSSVNLTSLASTPVAVQWTAESAFVFQ